jgi:hypothetical protein
LELSHHQARSNDKGGEKVAKKAKKVYKKKLQLIFTIAFLKLPKRRKIPFAKEVDFEILSG